VLHFQLGNGRDERQNTNFFVSPSLVARMRDKELVGVVVDYELFEEQMSDKLKGDIFHTSFIKVAPQLVNG